ncbi:unnamed protein product [Sordaria macrospora k-hell]|uniref:WGS project CABT00000000 data, contig 2.8 n=1 Tax=Sordaria macrospora (strain ATCC MYA-333 / DSM 997 / K(L3346) / K-hell) TaxID=771870 RepID=F7VUP6_SORMK|nr:uncharacterized protein SMAC_05001 [Sordaria macrospora k-hell]CCC09242.1 unnamed protein product [Sordaria macrospora k-hell]
MASTLPKLPVFEAISRHDPESTVVVHSNSGRTFKYGELLEDVYKTRNRLYETAGKEDLNGERIAFLVENSYDYVVTLLACLAAKSIAVPLSPAFPAPELQYILNHSEALLLLSSAKFTNKAQEVLKTELDSKPTLLELTKFQGGSQHEKVTLDTKSGPGEAGMMLYTSGTTNRPLHRVHVPPSTPDAVWKRFAAPFLPDTSDKEKVTFFTVVPTVYSRLLTTHKHLPDDFQAATREAIAPSNLRLAISGSAALPTPIKKAWHDLSSGNVLLERYGMTEVGMALSCGLETADRVDGSVGWPLPGVEARLVDIENNTIIEPGQEWDPETGRERAGEIQLRGPSIFREYWRNPEATAKEFVTDEKDVAGSKGRWFKTGDVAVRRPAPEGAGKSDRESQKDWARGDMYFILGRKSADIIKSGGEKVSALEVEREMLSLPQVAECAVLAVPSGKWGQKVGAVVILDREHVPEGKWSPLEMRRALKDRLAAYKIPQVLKIVDKIPRNAMGKINKKNLVKEVFADEFSGDEL